MSWQSALRKISNNVLENFNRPLFKTKQVDWNRLVTLDFETYYDDVYTLSKLSTSEYVRDPRFKAQMLYLKVGKKPAKIIPAAKIASELRKINWATHALLCHHTQFDGLILSHHYGIVPAFYYDTLSMARGLHSNEIGAGLEEVSIYYGGTGKLKDILETTKGVLDWSATLFAKVSPYCLQDGDETLRVFGEMVANFPEREVDLIDLIIRMFCDPVLRINLPKVQKELDRELAERKTLLSTVIDLKPYKADPTLYKSLLPKTAERALPPDEHDMLMTRRIIGSNNKFAELLESEGVDPPIKLSPAWMKRTKEQREATLDDKWTFAFAKDDLDFVNLPDVQDRWTVRYDLNKTSEVKALATKSERLRQLVAARIAVKSSNNITRAERFLISGANNMRLPVYYAYSRAHTHRLGGGDKRNMQNLRRGGELRLSIEAPPGHVLVVADSGQIEARVNGWLWKQEDLIERFATGADVYCAFASVVYGRVIGKDDKTERFLGKVCVLALGYQMGPERLQLTLARGALGGPPIFLSLEECRRIVNTYRRVNYKIANGWTICIKIIHDMAFGRSNSYGPISWEKDCVWLPNGLRLHYPDLRQTQADDGTPQWTYSSTVKGTVVRKKIYGGLLCENIVQALARIIVMEQMLNLSKHMRMVMTTHDEMVSCVKKARADASLKMMLKEMTTPLDWCEGLPLAAEGGYAENYSK